MGSKITKITKNNIDDYYIVRNDLIKYIMTNKDMTSEEFMIALKRNPDLIDIKPLHIKYVSLEVEMIPWHIYAIKMDISKLNKLIQFLEPNVNTCEKNYLNIIFDEIFSHKLENEHNDLKEYTDLALFVLENTRIKDLIRSEIQNCTNKYSIRTHTAKWYVQMICQYLGNLNYLSNENISYIIEKNLLNSNNDITKILDMINDNNRIINILYEIPSKINSYYQIQYGKLSDRTTYEYMEHNYLKKYFFKCTDHNIICNFIQLYTPFIDHFDFNALSTAQNISILRRLKDHGILSLHKSVILKLKINSELLLEIGNHLRFEHVDKEVFTYLKSFSDAWTDDTRRIMIALNPIYELYSPNI